MTSRAVTAVILAGGRSSRFGRDKLAESVDGRALLLHAIDGVAPLATEILVVAAPGATPALPPNVTLVHDPVAFEGPLAGVVAGLGAATAPVVVVIGGDMPTVVPAVIESMLREFDESRVDAVVLEDGDRARPLPLVLRRAPALAAADRLFRGGERRLRALPEALALRTIPEAAWRTLDPDGRTIRDIDTPADLAPG
jgi:molybdopterin-guanine dinucleotide biosynthesis protein A